MRNSFLLMLFFALSAHAQEWSSYFDGALFGTYVTETGPREPQNRLFSTNWFLVGTERQVGQREAVMFRGRFTLEPTRYEPVPDSRARAVVEQQ